MSTNPTNISISGRLSYPTWTYQEALAYDAKSDYPTADKTRVAPSFNLLLTQEQLDRYVAWVADTYRPFTMSSEAKVQLSQKDWDRIMAAIEDPELAPPYTPVRNPSEKVLELMPECVASIKVKGTNGMDLKQLAVVNSEEELLVPDDKILSYPVIQPIGLTVHDLYPGSVAAATLNHYHYMSGKTPGFSASSGTVVFKQDADRFGGGAELDEDAIFSDI